MKKLFLPLSTLLALALGFNSCVVHNHVPHVVYTTPEPVPPTQQVYIPDPEPMVVMEEEGGDYYRAPADVYNYYYSPDQNFYYCPDNYYFWWYEGSTWRSGYELPHRYTINTNTTYVTVIEKDNNPTRYNNNHVTYYKQGKYKNNTHRVGDNKNLHFERNAKTNTYYHKKEVNQVQQKNTNVDKNIRSNTENERRTYKKEVQQTPQPVNKTPQQKEYYKPEKQQTKVEKQSPAKENSREKTNQGRFNQGNPNAEIKPAQGTPPKARQKTEQMDNTPMQQTSTPNNERKVEKTRKVFNKEIELPTQQQSKTKTTSTPTTKEKSNNDRFNQGNPNAETKPAQGTPAKAKTEESKPQKKSATPQSTTTRSGRK